MGLEAWRFATKIAWVGLRAEDLAQLDLPIECFQNYSEKGAVTDAALHALTSRSPPSADSTPTECTQRLLHIDTA